MIQAGVRRILAVIGCVCVGLLVISAGEAVVDQIYPPPKDLATRGLVQIGAHWARAPKSVSITILVSYFIASAATSYLAARAAGKRTGRIAGQIVGALAIVNVITMPHPQWFYIGMAIAFTLGIWGAPELIPSAPPRPAA